MAKSDTDSVDIVKELTQLLRRVRDITGKESFRQIVDMVQYQEHKEDAGGDMGPDVLEEEPEEEYEEEEELFTTNFTSPVESVNLKRTQMGAYFYGGSKSSALSKQTLPSGETYEGEL